MGYQAYDEDSLALDPNSPFFWDHLSRYWWAASFAEGKRVLDVGCGRGYGSYVMARGAQEVIGLDLNKESLEEARRTFSRRNLKFLAADVAALGERGDRFELVTAFEVIEHIPSEATESFLKGLRNCLTPGGVLLLSTPNHDVVTKSGMPVPEFHINNFRPHDLRRKLGEFFPHVKMLGQYSRRSLFQEVFFFLDRWNFRHRIRRSWREPVAAVQSGEVSKGINQSALLSLLENKPKEVESYRFSPWHWRQAGLTMAVCRGAGV